MTINKGEGETMKTIGALTLLVMVGMGGGMAWADEYDDAMTSEVQHQQTLKDGAHLAALCWQWYPFPMDQAVPAKQPELLLATACQDELGLILLRYKQRAEGTSETQIQRNEAMLRNPKMKAMVEDLRQRVMTQAIANRVAKHPITKQ